MISYYFKENEMGRAKWHSYSYWSCFQQWYYWKNYWVGYNILCNKASWKMKWDWMLKWNAGSVTKIETKKMITWSTSKWEWSIGTKKSEWWLIWLFSQGIAQRVGNQTRMKAVSLPSGGEYITLLKSPHADKKSREQFIRKKWSLLWKLSYGTPEWNMGYVTWSEKKNIG